MSTPYNDQWVLDRPRPELHEEREGAPEARQPHTLRERGRTADPAVPSTLRRPVRKRPRWIDRDT